RALAEVGGEASLPAGERDHRPAKRVPHERLLLGGLPEGRQRTFGVVAVLLLRFDVDAIELERVLRHAGALEPLVDDGGSVGTSRDLELDAQPEAAEPLLERRATESAEHAGGANGRRERQGRPGAGLPHADALEGLPGAVA